MARAVPFIHARGGTSRCTQCSFDAMPPAPRLDRAHSARMVRLVTGPPIRIAERQCLVHLPMPRAPWSPLHRLIRHPLR